MKKLIFTVLISSLLGFAYGQMASVTYDYELNRFAENEPLPAETSFLINGSAPENINYIEAGIFSAGGKDNRPALAMGIWKQPYNRTGNDFHIPINFPLQAGKTYDLLISYFHPIDETERRQLYEQLAKYIEAYLVQSFEIKNKKIRLINSPRQTYKELNDLLKDGLNRYRGTTEPLFNEFSDIVRLQLERIDGKSINGSITTVSKTDTPAENAVQKSLPAPIDELRDFVDSEIKFVLNKNIAVLADRRYIDNYESESLKGYFGLDIGYGAAFFGGGLDDPNYDNGLYLGLGFPLSTSRIAPKFLRNASLGFGVFLNNMEDQERNVISGPILQRPFYLGLDYKLFSFIHFNFGAAFLERQANDNGTNAAVLVRPFVGISGKINISLSLGN